MIDTGDIDVFLGLDVGKGEHHGRTPPRRHLGRQEDLPFDQGKHHIRPCSGAPDDGPTSFAMLRDGTFHEPQPVRAVVPHT